MAIDKKLKQKLAAAKKMWGKAKNRAETEKGGLAEIEDGRYVARLTGAEIGESKSSGRLQVAWQYTIMEGDSKGSKKFDFDGLETEDNLMYLARKLAKYGYEAPDDLEEVEAVLAAIVKEKPLVKIRLKTKGGSDFQNVYVDQVFDKEEEDEALAEAAADAGETEDEEVAEEEEATEEEATEEEEESEEEEAAEEEEVAEEEEGEVELKVGMKVVVPFNGKQVGGSVIEILENEGKVRAKLDNGKVVRVPIDQLAVPADDEDAEEDVPEKPAPKKAPTKKK